VQEDIDRKPGASFRNIDSGAERRALKRQLQALTDKLPEIASQVRATERSIADAKLELFRLKDAKAHPGSAGAIVGTGPGGSVTESDRLKARAKAMMQQRSAALTGKPLPAGAEDASAAPQRLEAEKLRIRTEKENNERMVKDVEESVREFGAGLEDSLKDSGEDSTSEHERRRWEDGLGVEDDVKEFILDLQRSSRSATIRRDEDRSPRDRDRDRDRLGPSRGQDRDRTVSATRVDSSDRPALTPAASSASYSTFKSAEDRAAFIKQQAEQRMNERLAALGLKVPTKSGESAQQRQEREKKEREDRLRQAEEEDARREAERQRRLAEEHTTPPSVSKPTSAGKKPPPPPTRKVAKNDANANASAEKDESRPRAASGAQQKEQELRAQQEAQEEQTRNMEYAHLPCFLSPSCIIILTSIVGTNNVVKKRTSRGNVQQHKPDSKLSKNKSKPARSRKKRRNDGSRPRSERPKRRNPVLPRNVPRLKPPRNANVSCNFSSKPSIGRSRQMTMTSKM
jgi:hypothetical protein